MRGGGGQGLVPGLSLCADGCRGGEGVGAPPTEGLRGGGLLLRAGEGDLLWRSVCSREKWTCGQVAGGEESTVRLGTRGMGGNV